MSKASPRSKLTAKFIEALQADFEQHGAEVIEKLRQEAPARYAEVVARLCPTEAHVTQDLVGADLSDMTADEVEEYYLDGVEKLLAAREDCERAQATRERVRSFCKAYREFKEDAPPN
jgi:hypothetical protein